MAPATRRAPSRRPKAASVVVDRTDDLNKRRQAVREALKTADVVDLTKTDSPPAPLKSEHDSPPAPVKLEDLAVRPVSFTLELGHNIRNTIRSYKLTTDGWKDDDDGSVLSGLVDIQSVTKFVLQPATGYPRYLHLRPDGEGSLTGSYKSYGDDEVVISLDTEEMKAMIQDPWEEGRIFVASIGFCWAC